MLLSIRFAAAALVGDAAWELSARHHHICPSGGNLQPAEDDVSLLQVEASTAPTKTTVGNSEELLAASDSHADQLRGQVLSAAQAIRAELDRLDEALAVTGPRQLQASAVKQLAVELQGLAAEAAVVRRHAWQFLDDQDITGFQHEASLMQVLHPDEAHAVRAHLVEAETAHGPPSAAPHFNPWVCIMLFNLLLMIAGALAVVASPLTIQGLEKGKQQLQDASRHSFVQVVLPFWVPTTPQTCGFLFLVLLSLMICAVASATFWSAWLFLSIGHMVLPQIMPQGPVYGIYGNVGVRIITSIFLVATPLFFWTRRKDLKGRWEQWIIFSARTYIMLMLALWDVGCTYIVRKQLDAMVVYDSRTFWICIWMQLSGLVYRVICNSVGMALQQVIGIQWRAFVTHHFLDLYMARRSYYAMDAFGVNPGAIDNADQRVQEDARKVTEHLLTFVLGAMSAVVGVISFTLVLWSLMPGLTVAALLFTIVGSIMVLMLTRRLVKLNFISQKYEADFRYALTNIRNNTEAIAFYRGEAREKEITNRRFSSVVAVAYRTVGWAVLNNGLEEFYYSVATIVPIIMLYKRYFMGGLDYGAIGQATTAFGTTILSLSFIFKQRTSISELSTAANRLGSLLMFLKRPEDGTGIKCVATSESRLEIRNLTMTVPGSEEPLVRSLNLAIGGGRGPVRLMVVGPSGVGRSSLLRAVAGLWKSGSGEVVRPPNTDCVFLPQKPYMPLGSLRTQLLYPCVDSAVTEGKGKGSLLPPADDIELRDHLARVGLGHLPERFDEGLDSICDWGRVLSLGEQQRVAVVRILVQKPKMIVLDEATSAVSESGESRLYDHFKKLNISYVSVAHREGISKYHDMVLMLRGGADWKVFTAEEYLNSAERHEV